MKDYKKNGSPRKTGNINLDVEKCVGIIRSWHTYLDYVNPDCNTESDNYFKIWLPPNQLAIGADSSMIDQKNNWNSTQQTKQIKLAKPPGMRNLGATCYLNSQSQCLAQNLIFTLGVFSWNSKSSTDTHHSSRTNVLFAFNAASVEPNDFWPQTNCLYR